MDVRLIAELRRRKVFRTAGLYLIGAWLLVQVATSTFEPLGLPAWSVSFLVWAVVIGFPVCVALGWRYQLGPDGVARTQPAHGEPVDLSLRGSDYAIISVIVAIVGFVAYGVVSNFTDTAEQAGIPRTVTAPANAVAVLPFVNESADPDDAYLSAGLADQLRHQLQNLEPLLVPARESSRLAREAGSDFAMMAERLGVAWLVDGHMQNRGGRLEILVEIIDGRTGFAVWSGDYSGSSADLPRIHDSIATGVIGQIAPGADPSVVVQAPLANDATAHELFLIARNLEQEVRDEQVVDVPKLRRAIELYRAVVEREPDSAAALSHLAASLLYARDPDGAREYIGRAVLIDEESDDVQYTLGLYRWAVGQDGAGNAFREAIRLNPNHADALYAYANWLWLQAGEQTAPEPYYRRAIEVDPLSPLRYAELGNYLGLAGHKAKALELADSVRSRFDNEDGYLILARIYEVTGALDEAIAWVLKAKALVPERQELDWRIAELCARLGDAEMADRYDPDPQTPSLAKLFYLRRYNELIEAAQEAVLERPDELYAWNLLSHANNATGNPQATIYQLTGIGLPDIATRETRESAAIELMLPFIGALAATGESEPARRHAQWLADYAQRIYDSGGGASWWPNLYQACAFAVLGRDDEALGRLEAVPDAVGLVWYPLLKDALCLKKFENEPRYQSVVAAADAGIAEMRARLPQTLAAHGVTP